MSKLDYVTIAIVVICIGAIIFFVVKTTNLMNRDEQGPEPNRVEEALDNRSSTDIYDTLGQDTGVRAQDRLGYDTDDLEDDQVDAYDPTGESPSAAAAQRSEAGAGATSATKEPAPRGETAPAATTPAATSARSGDYLVLAGSFRYKANAEEMVKKLKRLGYPNAEVGLFNRGAYAVAMVDRFSDAGSARDLVDELKRKHNIDARVKKQE